LGSRHADSHASASASAEPSRGILNVDHKNLCKNKLDLRFEVAAFIKLATECSASRDDEHLILVQPGIEQRAHHSEGMCGPVVDVLDVNLRFRSGRSFASSRSRLLTLPPPLSLPSNGNGC
jgi:hypothetical protein